MLICYNDGFVILLKKFQFYLSQSSAPNLFSLSKTEVAKEGVKVGKRVWFFLVNVNCTTMDIDTVKVQGRVNI